MRRLLPLAFAAIPLLAAGCFYDDRCGAPGRELELRAVISGAAADTIATVYARLDEALGEVPAGRISLGIGDGPGTDPFPVSRSNA